MDLTPQTITDQLSKLPPDKDPYCWLADYLRVNYLPHYSIAAQVQIYLVVALLAVNVLLVLFSLYLRIRKNQFWFFRRQLSGALIQPNLAFVGGSLGLILLGVTIFLYLTVVKASGHHFPLYMGYVSLLLGVFPGLVGAVAIWSLSSSFLIHLHCQDPNRPLDKWILTSNIFGIAAPLVQLAIFLPLDLIAGGRYWRTVSTFFKIDKALRAEGTKWYTSTTNHDLSGLLTIVPLFDELVKEFSALEPMWQANYIFVSITTVLLVITLSVIASLYFSSVKRLIRRAQQAFNESGRGGELLDEVYRTWIGLVAAVVLFLVIAAITFGLSLFSAIRPLILSESYILTSFWSDTLLAVTMSGVLFWLSWILEPEPGEGEEQQIVTSEEKLAAANKLNRPPAARRRSSIWVEELYSRHPRGTRERGESDSTCVDYFSKLESVEELENAIDSDYSRSSSSEKRDEIIDLSSYSIK
ncbi:hypothetical protein JCM3765_007190 [Sporobolomyces pararoseus]